MTTKTALYAALAATLAPLAEVDASLADHAPDT
jgi:hypothetical protein